MKMPLKIETIRIGFKLPEPAASIYARMKPAERMKLMRRVRTFAMFQMAMFVMKTAAMNPRTSCMKR